MVAGRGVNFGSFQGLPHVAIRIEIRLEKAALFRFLVATHLKTFSKQSETVPKSSIRRTKQFKTHSGRAFRVLAKNSSEEASSERNMHNSCLERKCHSVFLGYIASPHLTEH